GVPVPTSLSEPTSWTNVVAVASLVLTSLVLAEVETPVVAPVVVDVESPPSPAVVVVASVVEPVDVGPAPLVDVDVVKAAPSPWHAHASPRTISARRSGSIAGTITQARRRSEPRVALMPQDGDHPG